MRVDDRMELFRLLIEYLFNLFHIINFKIKRKSQNNLRNKKN